MPYTLTKSFDGSGFYIVLIALTQIISYEIQTYNKAEGIYYLAGSGEEMQKLWKKKKVLFPIAAGILLFIAIF